MSGQNFTPVENGCSVPELSKDLLHLLDHPYDHFSDAVLKCDGVEIPVHKCILSVRSSVFAAMFRSQMREGRSGIVDIVDIELSVLRVMLRYLYGGKLDSLSDSMAEGLLFAADKYALKDLKRICIDTLKSRLTVDNIADILILGELHDVHLKKHAKEFICKCKFSDLEATEGWKSLLARYPKLAMEVMRSIVIYGEETHIFEIAVRYIGILTLHIEDAYSCTVKDVKLKIFEINPRLVPERQSLEKMIKNHIFPTSLEDERKLSDYGITNNTTLQLYGKPVRRPAPLLVPRVK